MATQTKSRPRRTSTRPRRRIRELNEQILSSAARPTAFLDAYERNLKTFADYQDKVADQTRSSGSLDRPRAGELHPRDLARLHVERRDLLK